VPDNAAPFLVAAGEKAGDIGNGQQRDIKGIAEADEAGGFVRGVDIQAAG